MDSNFNFGGNKTSEAPTGLAAEAWGKPARTESSSETGSGHLRDLFKDRSNRPKPSENKQESKTDVLPQFSWSIPAFPAKPEAKPAQGTEAKSATKPEPPKTDDKLPPLRIGTGSDERPPRRNERTDENKPLRAGLSHRYNDI